MLFSSSTKTTGLPLPLEAIVEKQFYLKVSPVPDLTATKTNFRTSQFLPATPRFCLEVHLEIGNLRHWDTVECDTVEQ